MKKLLFLSFCTLGIGGVFAIATAFTPKSSPHPKPSLDGDICTTYSIVQNDCVGSPTNCLCEVVVTPNCLAALNTAIANGTTTNFFSNNENIQTFGLYPDQAQELQSTSTWVIRNYNQKSGKYFYGVGSAANQSFENVDFVMDVVTNSN